MLTGPRAFQEILWPCGWSCQRSGLFDFWLRFGSVTGLFKPEVSSIYWRGLPGVEREQNMEADKKIKSGRRYDAGFKESAVGLIKSGRSFNAVAEDLGVSAWTIRMWVIRTISSSKQLSGGTWNYSEVAPGPKLPMQRERRDSPSLFQAYFSGWFSYKVGNECRGQPHAWNWGRTRRCPGNDGQHAGQPCVRQK